MFHSTLSMVSALLKACSRFSMALGKGHVALGLLDLRAAFDTNGILLKEFDVLFGVCIAPLKWMKSYVTDHTLTVLFNW